GIHLEGLGGTEGGVIGSLAAIGLALPQNDGRIVQFGRWPDDLHGLQPVAVLRERDVDVRDLDTQTYIEAALVDVGKHLRPNLRQGRSVLFVRREKLEGQTAT